METDIKAGDCVQLKFGDNPKMNVISVQSVFDGTIDVECTWFESKKNQGKIFKAHVLKLCDDTKSDDIDKEDIMSWRKFIKEKNEREKGQDSNG